GGYVLRASGETRAVEGVCLQPGDAKSAAVFGGVGGSAASGDSDSTDARSAFHWIGEQSSAGAATTCAGEAAETADDACGSSVTACVATAAGVEGEGAGRKTT